mmetsp:Transcript_19647/g.57321  ORF Transcript_19647/g.57321 Transcript_19647/m.57321 type:complete len:209 (+) Transcript_19647:1629-2255(+)
MAWRPRAATRSAISPWSTMGSCSPAAIRSCHSTRSSPVTSSVTGCSTWSRVFISQKKYSFVFESSRNSTVPAPMYPTALAAFTAASPMEFRISGSRRGAGDSSRTFWWRRCTEQSRSKRWTALPCASAKIWNSTCLGLVTNRSSRTLSSLKLFIASRLQASSADKKSSSRSTRRMPLPPPPRVALMRTGKRISLASARRRSGDWSSPW